LALFTTGLVYVYLNHGSCSDKQVKTGTVVALTTFETLRSPDMLETKKIEEDAVHPDALTSIDDVVGGTTTTDLMAGEQILSERIVSDTGAGPLAYRVPESMRAITVPTTEVASIGGYIMPGDKIDILARYPSLDACS
jgi:pilus assembly protein CpaB